MKWCYNRLYYVFIYFGLHYTDCQSHFLALAVSKMHVEWVKSVVKLLLIVYNYAT
jgi:hypothetical protein